MADRDALLAAVRQYLAEDHGPLPVALIAALGETRAEDIAALLSAVEDQQVEQLFDLLQREKPDLAAEVLTLLGRHDVSRVLRSLTDDRVADVLESMPADDATWAIELLSEERVAAVVGAMEEEESRDLRERLEYPDDSAGRFMSFEFLALSEAALAGDAIRRLQEADEDVTIFYVYLVDDRGRLSGVVSLRRLLRVKPERKLESLIAGDVITVNVTDDQEDVARVFAQNDFVCLPVIDEERMLVGVVTHDDVLDVLREEATEDILQMAGTKPDDMIAESVWTSARLRMPWLLFSLIGGVVAMKTLDLQARSLGDLFVVLALFVPVIVGMGGNVGTQAATIVVRGLATGRVQRHDVLPVLWRELRAAGLMGLTYGVLLGLTAFVALQKTPLFSGVVGVSLAASMLMASLFGTLLPIIFQAVGVDPAVATGPLVTTTMDNLGILTYLTLAGWLLL